MATYSEIREVAAAVHADPVAFARGVGVDLDPGALMIVVVWNGRVFQATGNDAAVASRLAPSCSLRALGRGLPLLATVRSPRRLAEQARRAGIAVGFAEPEWVDGIPADHEIGFLRGYSWRQQLREVTEHGANFMVYPAAGRMG